MTNKVGEMEIHSVNKILERYGDNFSPDKWTEYLYNGLISSDIVKTFLKEKYQFGHEWDDYRSVQEQRYIVQGIIDSIMQLHDIADQEKKDQKRKQEKYVYLTRLKNQHKLKDTEKTHFLLLLTNDEFIVLYFGVYMKSLQKESKGNKIKIAQDLNLLSQEAKRRDMHIGNLQHMYFSIPEETRNGILKTYGRLIQV